MSPMRWQANIRAALAGDEAQGEVYNVAVGERTSLTQLFSLLVGTLGQHQIHYGSEPLFQDFRAGDVRHSLASIDKARRLLGYEPTHRIHEGLEEAMPWYVDFVRSPPVRRPAPQLVEVDRLADYLSCAVGATAPRRHCVIGGMIAGCWSTQSGWGVEAIHTWHGESVSTLVTALP